MPFPTACKGELHRSRGTHTLLFSFSVRSASFLLEGGVAFVLLPGIFFVPPDVGQ